MNKFLGLIFLSTISSQFAHSEAVSWLFGDGTHAAVFHIDKQRREGWDYIEFGKVKDGTLTPGEKRILYQGDLWAVSFNRGSEEIKNQKVVAIKKVRSSSGIVLSAMNDRVVWIDQEGHAGVFPIVASELTQWSARPIVRSAFYVITIGDEKAGYTLILRPSDGKFAVFSDSQALDIESSTANVTFGFMDRVAINGVVGNVKINRFDDYAYTENTLLPVHDRSASTNALVEAPLINPGPVGQPQEKTTHKNVISVDFASRKKPMRETLSTDMVSVVPIDGKMVSRDKFKALLSANIDSRLRRIASENGVVVEVLNKEEMIDNLVQSNYKEGPSHKPRLQRLRDAQFEFDIEVRRALEKLPEGTHKLIFNYYPRQAKDGKTIQPVFRYCIDQLDTARIGE